MYAPTFLELENINSCSYDVRRQGRLTIMTNTRKKVETLEIENTLKMIKVVKVVSVECTLNL